MSTDHAILFLALFVNSALNQEWKVASVFFWQCENASDAVDHGILLVKLRNCGFCQFFIFWSFGIVSLRSKTVRQCWWNQTGSWKCHIQCSSGVCFRTPFVSYIYRRPAKYYQRTAKHQNYFFLILLTTCILLLQRKARKCLCRIFKLAC